MKVVVVVVVLVALAAAEEPVVAKAVEPVVQPAADAVQPLAEQATQAAPAVPSPEPSAGPLTDAVQPGLQPAAVQPGLQAVVQSAPAVQPGVQPAAVQPGLQPGLQPAGQPADAALLGLQPALSNRFPAPPAQLVVQPAVHAAPLVADSSTLVYRLFAAPADWQAKKRRSEQDGLQRVLDGPVLVSFRDPERPQMQTYLLPNGLGDLTCYNPNEIAPLTQFMTTGSSKVLLFLSAFVYLRLESINLPLSDIRVPSYYNLKHAFRIAEDLPYPHIIVVAERELAFSRLPLDTVGELQLQLRPAQREYDSLQQAYQQTVAPVAFAAPVRRIEYLVPVSAALQDQQVPASRYQQLLVPLAQQPGPVYHTRDRRE